MSELCYVVCVSVAELVTCEDVLSRDVDLHLQWVLGGVSDLSGDMGDLANEHGRQELRLLHPNQSSQTAVLERGNRKPTTHANTLCYINSEH